MSKKGLLMSTEITTMHAVCKQLRTDHNNKWKTHIFKFKWFFYVTDIFSHGQGKTS